MNKAKLACNFDAIQSLQIPPQFLVHVDIIQHLRFIF